MPMIGRAAAKAFSVIENPARMTGRIGSMFDIPQHSRAGVDVSPASALGLTAVYSSVSLLSETIGALPTGIIEVGDVTRTPVAPDQFSALTGDEASPYQTLGSLFETIVASGNLHGNFYGQCRYDPAGNWRETIAIDPEGVTAKAEDNGITFEVRGYGSARNVKGDPHPPIMFIPGLVLPGRITGLSPIANAMEQLGLGLAIERTAAGFYGNGMNPAGIVEVKGKATPEQAAGLAARLKAAAGGVERGGKWLVMDEGATLRPLMIPPQQAQFIEQQRYSNQRIAAIFRVPPHLIGDVERSTSWGAGIEEQTIGFVTYSLMPHINRIERVINRHLGKGFQFKFALQGLLRGSTEARYRAYALGRIGGWLTVNQIRALEDMPPIGPAGDVYLAASGVSNLAELIGIPGAKPTIAEPDPAAIAA